MNDEVQQFLNEIGPALGGAAFAWGAVGALVGAVLGLAVHVGLIGLGAYTGRDGRGGWFRWLAGAWSLLGTALLVALTAAVGGLAWNLGGAVLETQLGQETLVRLGEPFADTAVAAVAASTEVLGVGSPAGSPPSEDLVAAVRDGRWAVPVEQARALAQGLGETLRGPAADEVSAALIARVGELVAPAHRDRAVEEVSRALASARSGVLGERQPLVAGLWRDLDAIAARDGIGGTLSHEDLSVGQVERVLLQRLERAVVTPAIGLGLVCLALLVPLWGLPPAVFGLAMWIWARD